VSLRASFEALGAGIDAQATRIAALGTSKEVCRRGE
jgi:hypothetical protein